MGSTARRTAVGIIAVAVTAGFASSAEGGPARARTAVAARPIAHVAFAIRHCGLNGCTETSQLTMAANGGLGETMTDQIPANATEASVTIAPICKVAADRRGARAAACNDGSFTEMLDTFVGDLPQLARLTPGKPETRLMGCVFLAFSAKVQLGELVPALKEQANSVATAVLLTCVEILAAEAGPTTHPKTDLAAVASVAAQRCGRLVQTVRARFTKSGSKVVAQPVGSPTTSSHRMPVSVSCKRAGGGMVITLKATRRGQKLPKVIGPTVGIGYVNPGPLPASVKTTFKVN
ncbi:MAG TPA: hypothetical protein VG410_05640 [Solirubrobacteraceae bacterium]|jgi:hypothetical protein|nr:hypothetical protein [Solirubrobacteraceae bacterium]